MEQTLLLIQLSDSAFPTGGFSHSLGLESCVQHKHVHNSESLKTAIIGLLENTGSFNLPFVQEAFRSCSDLDMLRQLDRLYHVSTANHVASRASSRQGKAMATTSSQVFGVDDISQLCTGLDHCHHAVVFGAVCSSLGLTVDLVLTAFMSATLRTALASAVRLDKCGPVEAQKIVAELQTHIPDVIHRNRDRTTEDACLSFPIVDIAQNCHDKLFCKLFYS